MLAYGFKVRLWDLPRTEQATIAFLQQFNILPEKRLCSNLHTMRLYFDPKPIWKCDDSSCNQQIDIRTGNWFEKTHLPFTTMLRFIYCWSKEYTSTKFCYEQLDMSEETVFEWYNYLREVCALALQDDEHKMIGEENLAMETDYGAEFIWRKNLETQGKDYFDSILQSIAQKFPPETKG